MSVAVLDAEQLSSLPQTGHALDRTACYIASMVRQGPRSFINNANVRMAVLVVDQKVLPLVISEGVAGNSNICSAHSHYVEYAFEEFAKNHPRLPSGLLKVSKSLLSAVVKSGSIDRMIFVNNWMFTTNPRHGLSPAQISEVTACLMRRFPDSAIVFRSVNRTIDPSGFEALRANRYRIIPSRRVYMLDTRDQRYLARRDVRRDLAKLSKTSYSIVEIPEAMTPQVGRMEALYRDLYLGKYSGLNPDYNADFFAITLKDQFLTYRGFIKDGRLDGFVSYFFEDDSMTASLLAHDRSLPQKLGLYRLAFALLIQEAAQRKALLNMSAGAGEFKSLRGAEMVQESDAVYDSHLPPARRLPWVIIKLITHFGRLLP